MGGLNKFKMANKSTMGSEKKRFSSIPVAKKEKHGKNEAEEDTFDLVPGEDKPCGMYYVISLFTLAFGFGCLHIYHVSTLFENDRHFSHLSMMEREMTFRTEMGLYYSYYKRIIEAPSFIEGLEQITNDNLTEYPKVINTLQRFNLCPEVLIGLLFRTYLYFMDLLDIPTKQCWQIERGQNLPPVTSCEGLGDPIYFYIEMVWICAGLTMGLVFIYGLVISRSIIGGSLSVICFFYNHSECTRIQWTPPLRESFAYPFILLQLLCVTYFLRRSSNAIPRIVQMSVISISSWVCLLLWQFSQFVIASQVIAVFAMFLFKIIKKDLLTLILMSQMLGVLQATISLYGNKLIVCSLLTSMLSSLLLILLLVEPLVAQCNAAVRGVALTSLVAGGTLLTKQFLNFFFNNKDDDHILNILRSKLTGFKDFHSLLYTCSVEFDFMKTDILKKLSITLLIPSVLFVLTLVVFHWGRVYYRNMKKTTEKQKKKGERERWVAVVEPDVVYNMLQLFAFTIMAFFIMRLKLFFTPQLCILAALLATRKYFRFFKTVEIHWAILAVMLGGMSIQGIENLQDQRSILGEYSDVPLEELLTWVNTETKPNAVFAGPMPTMANLLLSTRRPIVNHPHYEDAGLRERTKKVYSIFSRKSSQDVFLTLLDMKVEYVILDESWCFRESKKGCSMVDLWDVEEPFNKHRPPLCPQLFIKTPPPFHRVFANENYVVLRLLSQYVEIKPSQEFKF